MLRIVRAEAFGHERPIVRDGVWPLGFLYFPHVWTMFFDAPAIMGIEHIIQGQGTIKGLPAGVGPDSVNLDDFDGPFSWSE